MVFSDAGLKKFAAALLVVAVVTLRFAGGGEISRFAVAERLRELADMTDLKPALDICREQLIWSVVNLVSRFIYVVV